MADPHKSVRWSSPVDTFARSLSLEDNDIPRGILSDSIVIEPGTRACAMVDGKFLGEIPAGQFTFRDFRDKLQFWRTGQATFLLTRSDVVRLPVNCQGILSADDVPVDVRIDVGVQVDDPVLFMKNLMGPRKDYPVHELAERLTPAVKQEAWMAAAQLKVEELRGAAIAAKVAQQVVDAIAPTFRRYGLAVFSVEGMLMQPSGMERHWEKVKEHNIELAGDRLENKRLSQDIEIQQQRGPLDAQLRDVQLSNDRATQKVEKDHGTATLAAEVTTCTDRIPLFERLRDAAIANEFDKAKSAEELKQLLAGIDKQRLLRKEEMEQIAEGFEERKEDRGALRQHIVAVLDINRQQEIDQLRATVGHSLQLQSLKNDLELAEATTAIENQQWRAEIAREIDLAEKRREERKRALGAKWERIREAQRQRQDASWEKLLHAQREEAIRTELALKEADRQSRLVIIQVELKRRVEEQAIATERLRREFELEMGGRESDAQLERLKRVQEMNAQQARVAEDLKAQAEGRANSHELERLRTMGGLGADALIAVSGTDNARALAELKMQEAKAQAEIQTANRGDQQAMNEERLRLYERLSESEKSRADAVADVFQQALKGQQAAVEQMITGLAAAHTPAQPAPARAAAPPPAPGTAAEWHVIGEGQTQSGPHTYRQVQMMIQQGRLAAEAHVWKAGMAGWVAAIDVPELADAFAMVPPEPPAAPVPPPPPRA